MWKLMEQYSPEKKYYVDIPSNEVRSEFRWNQIGRDLNDLKEVFPVFSEETSDRIIGWRVLILE